MKTGDAIAQQSGERRSKPRITVPFHAKVEGTDVRGSEFSVETVLDNLSGEGLYLRIMPSVAEGTKLSIVVGLRTPWEVTAWRATDSGAARFLADGVVVRTDRKTGGVCGIAVKFDNVRFL